MTKQKLYWHCERWNAGNKQVGGLRSKKNKQQEFYGYLSSLAYKNPKIREEGLAKHGFILDKDLSNDDIMVAYNPKTFEVVNSMTGSRFSDKKHAMRDIRSDIGIAMGTDRLGKRTKELSNVVKKVQSKYGKDYNYTNTGHSLGSRVSMNVSKKLGIDHVGFNQGSSPLGAISDRLAKLFGKDKEATRINYTTGKDILSKSSQLFDDVETNVVDMKKEVPDTIVGKHSIKNFTGMEGSGKQKGKGGKGSGDHKTNVKKSPWLIHVDQIRRKNPKLKYKECLTLASKSYSKNK